MDIPLCVPFIDEEEIEEVKEVLKSGWLAHGPKNKEFEERFAEYIHVKYAASLNSCTSALQLALQANSITGEVIVPSFTFVASVNAIVTAGAKPVFADIEYETCNICPDKIRKAVTKNTQAIMPVHYAGQSCRMDEIMEIAQRHSLLVVEDSAECLGGLFKGKKTGSFGIGCFSFYPTKNITTGEGGMLTTNDSGLAEKIKALRAHGISSSAYERQKKSSWLRAAIYSGYNYRLSDILAAIGVVQLKKLDNMNEMRRQNAEYLSQNLASIKEIQTPVELKDCRHVYQMYTIKLAGNIDRIKFISKLKEKGINASVHFDPPVHNQPAYSHLAHNNLKITEKAAKTIVTLPMYPQLSKGQLDYIIEGVKEAVRGNKS